MEIKKSFKVDTEKIEWLLKNESQYSISKNTGVSQSYLSKIVNGNKSIENLTVGLASNLTEYALALQEKRRGNKMEKLFININETKQSSYQLEQLIKSSMVNDYFCFDTYKELAEFIRSYCFNENHEFESNIPFDTRFEEFESNPEDDDAYNTFYESLTEKDFKEICEEFKRENKIEYIEFDVDDEIKYFKQSTKDALAKYSDYEQRAIVLNFLDVPYNQLESEVVEALESDEVEFATIDNKEQFK